MFSLVMKDLEWEKKRHFASNYTAEILWASRNFCVLRMEVIVIWVGLNAFEYFNE